MPNSETKETIIHRQIAFEKAVRLEATEDQLNRARECLDAAKLADDPDALQHAQANYEHAESAYTIAVRESEAHPIPESDCG